MWRVRWVARVAHIRRGHAALGPCTPARTHGMRRARGPLAMHVARRQRPGRTRVRATRPAHLRALALTRPSSAHSLRCSALFVRLELTIPGPPRMAVLPSCMAPIRERDNGSRAAASCAQGDAEYSLVRNGATVADCLGAPRVLRELGVSSRHQLQQGRRGGRPAAAAPPAAAPAPTAAAARSAPRRCSAPHLLPQQRQRAAAPLSAAPAPTAAAAWR
ncbi:MAG: hypothetical protein J3K34DRAFT_127341 [Monoraphidium minutum]|nr:MAG: hypothetical protein J3K34DRAFT_127341 [Monoraphidium minutum]